VWGTTPTSYRYTGQRSETSLSIYYYGARWYDSSLGRFLSPDTIVPEASQGVQAWDRMAYTNNNPVRFNDPSGHVCSDPKAPHQRCDGGPNRNYHGYTGGSKQSKPPFDASLGENNKDDIKSSNGDDNRPNPPKWGGIIIGGILAIGGAGVTAVGLGFAVKGEFAGLFIAGAGALVGGLGLELAYQSLGDLKPKSWPDYLLIPDFKLP
jgi:RHS repeat-associated protein